MNLNRVICAFFFFVVLHLSFLVVSGSVVQRSLSDDIKNGISIAGKLFGFDSPSNIATVSNIADLVSRAFSNNAYTGRKHYGWNDKNSYDKRPTEKLETFSGEIPIQQHQGSASHEESIDDNVIVGTGYGTNTETTTEVDHGFLGQVLRVLGMDTSKIGAMALNGIIFIAQMIGRSFISAITGMTGNSNQKSPIETSDTAGGAKRFSGEYKTEQPRSMPIVDNAFDWILDRSKQHSFLSQQLNVMLDKRLPERIINYIDDGNDDNQQQQQNTDCIKLLICKTAPIIQGMQRAVSTQINGEESETTEPDENSSNHNNDNASTVNDYRMNAFFKHLPTVDEFRDHGGTCENRFNNCKLF